MKNSKPCHNSQLLQQFLDSLEIEIVLTEILPNKTHVLIGIGYTHTPMLWFDPILKKRKGYPNLVPLPSKLVYYTYTNKTGQSP